jgi:hypothetical protein
MGGAKANTKVAESLFRKATGDGPQSVAAAIFWLLRPALAGRRPPSTNTAAQKACRSSSSGRSSILSTPTRPA